MSVQSFLFPKNIYTPNDAIRWLKVKGYKPLKMHETLNYYRFRILPPNKKYSYVTVDFGNYIKAVIAINQ